MNLELGRLTNDNKSGTPRNVGGNLRQNFSEGLKVDRDQAVHGDSLAGQVLGEMRDLEVRLASSESEIRASQALRYQVFYKEMSADPSADMAAVERDFDAYDDVVDHLLVVDKTRTGDDAVIGTYRLLPQRAMEQGVRDGLIPGFYTAGEYDIGPMMAATADSKSMKGNQFLELGRSCVREGWRNNSTIQLLWRGITAYVVHHKIGCMFGCASLEGTDPEALAVPLSFLHHNFAGEAPWAARALDKHYVDMNLLPSDQIDMKAALKALPPLVKGYLRLGALIGDGAVVDHQFGTTDVMIILPIERISDRYIKRFDT